MSETCRVSCQNKFVKLVHLVGFIINKFVTMQHGHMDVKKSFYAFLRLPVDGCVRQPKHVAAQYNGYVLFIVLCY
jgi:hypothetical protein